MSSVFRNYAFFGAILALSIVGIASSHHFGTYRQAIFEAFDPMFHAPIGLVDSHSQTNLHLDTEIRAGALLPSELALFEVNGTNGAFASSNAAAIGLNNFSDFAVDQLTGFRSTLQNISSRSQASEVAFVDQSAEGWQDLSADLKQQKIDGRELDVILLDPNLDGIEQITNALRDYDHLSTIHIISHGKDGLVQLGNSQLSGESLTGYAGDLASWNSSLESHSDLLFYGCNLASSETGRWLTEAISELTGADVAASTNLTGSKTLGGDWDLEFQTGGIESEVALSAAAQSQWQYVLDINIDQAWLDANGGPAGPYYLDQAGETYILQTDVSADATAFAIIGNDIVFDLNGYTITYDAAPAADVVNHSFENGSAANADGWDFTNSTGVERYQGEFLENEVYDGDYALRFDGASDQMITSTSTVTLEANTSYSLSAMFQYGGYNEENGGVKGYVQLVGSGLETREVSWSDTNYRGIQFREFEFTTGAVAETYSIQVGLENSDSNQADFFIDDIKIQRRKVHGVVAGVVNTNNFPGLDRTGVGVSTVKNGKIIQGQGGATWAHGISIHALSEGSVFEDLEVEVSGANSSVLRGLGFTTQTVTVRNNVLTSNVQTISSRDNYHGAMVFSVGGEIANNTLLNGPHGGIVNYDFAANIHGNTIRQKTKYSNAFAIVANEGSQIYDNTIDNTGEFTGRGIFTKGDSDPNKVTRIYGNTVKVQEGINNQEYGGAVLGGSYGIQVENGRNIEVYENDVYAYGNSVKASAFRINDKGSGTGVKVWDNIFRAISNGTPAHAVKANGISNSAVEFWDNTIITNDGILTAQGSDFSMASTHFVVLDTVAEPQTFFTKRVYGSQVNFVDSTFEDNSSLLYVTNASVLDEFGNPNPNASFAFQWSTTVHVQDLSGDAMPGAAVSINDFNGNEVFSGDTNESGDALAVLEHFRTSGDNRVDQGLYTATAAAAGEQDDAQFSADKIQTIEIELNVNAPSIDDYTLTYDGTTLYVDATDADNEFVWSAENALQFSIDGFQFEALAGTEVIHFRGGIGADSIDMTGSSEEDQLNLSAGRAIFTAPTVQIQTWSIEDISLDAGAGSDLAYLQGTDGDDLFQLSANFANVASSLWNFQSVGFVRATALDSAGNDTVEFYDTLGNDQFFGYGDYSIMYSGDSVLRANEFEVVEANAELGGWDRATLNDTAGDDLVTANAFMGKMESDSESREVRGFDRTYFNSTSGFDSAIFTGTDQRQSVVGDVDGTTFRGSEFSYRAFNFAQVTIDGGGGNDGIYLNDSELDDLFELSSEQFRWEANGRSLVANGFKSQVVRSTMGSDMARLFDTDADDRLKSLAGSNVLSSSESYLKAIGFENISTFATGGNDVAIFTGSSADETISLSAGSVIINDGSSTRRAFGFEVTNSYLNNGGTDTASFIGSELDETLVGDLYGLRAYGNGYSNYVHGFASASATGGSGQDAFYLADSAANDTAILGPSASSFANLQRSIEMTGYETQVIHSSSGGNDQVTLFDSVANDNLFSDANFTLLSNTELYLRAVGFELVTAIANAGGSDSLVTKGTSSVDQVELVSNQIRQTGGGIIRALEGFETSDVYLNLATDSYFEDNYWNEYEIIDEDV